MLKNIKKFYNGLENVIANLGTTKDKRSHNQLKGNTFEVDQLTILYDNWLIRKAIDIPVNDAVRKWRRFEGVDIEQIKKLESAERALKVKQTVGTAGKRGRLFGGALLLMGIEGAGALSEPLELESVKQDSLKFIKVIDRDFVTPGPIDSENPTAVNFMTPEFYTLSNDETIHSSRVLRFDGLDVPDTKKIENEYWTASVAEIIYDTVLDVNIATASSSSLMHESKIDIIKIPDLANTVSTTDGEELVRNRFQIADQIKSTNNMLLLDGEEEFVRNEYSFAGIEPLLTKYLMIVSSASDIPATRLLGQSAIGMNATGEGDEANYQNLVAGYQEDQLAPEMAKFDEVFVRSVLGNMPPEYDSVFLPLGETDAKEDADTAYVNMQTSVGYVNAGILPPHVVAARLLAENEYPELSEELVGLIKEVDDERRILAEENTIDGDD